jgi:hypothetical protein
MTKQGNRRPPSLIILRTALLAIGVLVVLHLLLQYLNLQVYNEANGRIFELSNRLDLDDETSVPSWFSHVLLLTIGLAAGLAAYLQTEKRLRWIWGSIASLSVIMSLDEAASLHEHSLQTLHVYVFKEAAPTVMQNAWLLVLPIVLALAIASGYVLYNYFPRRTAKLFILGGVIFLTGAVAVDLLSTAVSEESFAHQGVMVGVEESLELVGATIILYAIVDYIERFKSKELARKLRRLAEDIG